jgi:hypothetical protein
MTMAYFSSFDVTQIGASTITLSTAGKSSIAVNIASLTSPVSLGETAFDHVFNHVVSRDWAGFGPNNDFQLLTSCSYSFMFAVQLYLRSAASLASWTSPNSIALSINTTTWHMTIAYPTALTAITFGNTETRRLFGFSGNFAGSSASVTGSEVPKYIIVPEVDGASSATHVYEQDDVSSVAYSAGGRGYSMSRGSNPHLRDWTQQYETKAKTFRKFAAAAPNETTYQLLFENCRLGYPFGVYGGFGEEQYQAYILRSGGEAFSAKPATPGNANQFHIPFKAYAMAWVNP